MNQSNNPRLFKLVFFLLITGLLTLSFLVWRLYTTRPRIAYVRSLELIYSYNGMREAHNEFQNQTNAWQSNVDTLRIRYERQRMEYEQQSAAWSAKEKEEKEAILGRMKHDLDNYTQVIRQQAKEKEQSMTQSVLSQINSYVERYAKKKGYDLVFGAEGTGSIIYGRDAYDITAEILEELNKEYKLLPAADSTRQP